MYRTTTYSRLGQPLLAAARGFCTSKSSGNEKIVASVLFERLPVVIPKIDPVVYAFQEFSYRWNHQYRRELPESFLKKSEDRGKGEHDIDYVPAPQATEADESNDRRSLQRALDRRLYLLLYGTSYNSNGAHVWHLPEKVYESEESLRKCAESALESVLGDLSNSYFIGNAPIGHMILQEAALKRFFFKSQLIEAEKFDIKKYEDYLWVTKEELLEHFPEHAEYLNKMIIN